MKADTARITAQLRVTPKRVGAYAKTFGARINDLASALSAISYDCEGFLTWKIGATTLEFSIDNCCLGWQLWPMLISGLLESEYAAVDTYQTEDGYTLRWKRIRDFVLVSGDAPNLPVGCDPYPRVVNVRLPLRDVLCVHVTIFRELLDLVRRLYPQSTESRDFLDFERLTENLAARLR